ncbi:hypothetical protein HMPREF0044_0513 [Gleimia coleocanis DSM 15436]|uniref:Uncharacterized protein n=1 Tax=Gleimia coleocanis DSM 15436 TaxID=525245 RepID=C0VZC3_9ACTO|nr:RNA-binding S4 domain-containing protein [Gleimia coleocanis]EEH64224.1 hypothetical protein HMPREF0044_0513 [Gleimia coleocanis DSM 15436]
MDNEEIPVITVTGTIRLGQLLKLANLVEDGGEARAAIQGGFVYIDDEQCTQRGKQLQDGQIVSLDFEDYLESVQVEILPE